LRSQGEQLCDAIPIYAGDRVLDVATASGNTGISAARRRAIVTGIDLVPSLLDYARRRAEIEGFNIDFREGNAMALAFPDASFDVIASTFGLTVNVNRVSLHQSQSYLHATDRFRVP